ncbi:MAG: hypothetical protein NTW29_06235 [Bacteroidetes bacterium]|nr:hypothetical protein [Bacteroidota bacterium]
MKARMISLSVIAILLFSCERDIKIGDKYVTLSRKQTYCADPWPMAASDSLTLENVKAYINANNLYIADLTIRLDTAPDLCAACFCKTGKTIYVSTLYSDTMVARYGRIGFTQ